ncbi:MAG TPA: ATP-binding protein [Acetobacteraceae bacterium]|nr:ATP-binding protein [Acetobacteraceae bacterium]
MLSDDELRVLLHSGEADNAERTVSLRDRSKFGEAICAFANDLADRRMPGVLFVGVADDGSCGNLTIDEQLLQTLMGFRSDGNILPPPVMQVRRHTLDGCTMAIVEVQPAENPPIKYDGRVCVRVGPRRGYATAEEERRLVEKRRWGALPFDQQPVAGASMADLDLLRFREEYLPTVVHPDVLAENGRTVEEQMRALGIIGPERRPTALGLLVCGKDPRAWLPGAYVQFVRYPGTAIGDMVQDQKEIGGPLAVMLRQIDEVIAANIELAADLSGPVQRVRASYPPIALQELVRNAVIHRTYEMTTAPVMLTWYADRVEITSPGGPYGVVTAETFGQPGVTDARNPALASAAKAMGFVQRFGSGIPRARMALQSNGNPPPEFRVEPNFVNVTVRAVP